MRRSFRSVWYAVISNPLQVAMLAGVAVGMAAGVLTGEMLIFILILLYLLPFVILERTSPQGRPRILSRKLTPMFYALRSPSGRFCIVQNCLPGPIDCRALIRALTAQTRLLPNALISAPGRYRAITHESVLHRITAIPVAVIENAKPVYMADMSAMLNYLTNGRCRKCSHSCPAVFGSKDKRQFYDVKFTIRGE